MLSAEPGTAVKGTLLGLWPVTVAAMALIVWGRNSGPDWLTGTLGGFRELRVRERRANAGWPGSSHHCTQQAQCWPIRHSGAMKMF